MLSPGDIVKEYLNKNGPSLPIEIGKALGYNSLLTKAVLTELISQGIIKQSKKTVGNSLLYYLTGQDDLVRKKLYNELSIPEKHALTRFREANKPLTIDELSPQERYVINNLLDFVEMNMINNERVFTLKGFIYPTQKKEAPRIQLPTIMPKPVVMPQPLQQERQFEVPQLFSIKPKKEEPKIEESEDDDSKGGFDDEVIKHLKRMGEYTVAKVIRRDRETNYVLKLEKPFTQTFFVKSKNKQRINESDLSLIYTETLQEKKPGLLITKGDLTSTAKKWMKDNVGDLITLVRI